MDKGSSIALAKERGGRVKSHPNSRHLCYPVAAALCWARLVVQPGGLVSDRRDGCGECR